MTHISFTVRLLAIALLETNSIEGTDMKANYATKIEH